MALRFDQPDTTAEEIGRARTVRRMRQFRIRTIMAAILVAGVWFAYLRIPGAWLLVAGPIVALAIAIGVMAAGMALALSGIVFFGWLERGITRIVRGRPMPDALDDFGK